MSKLIYILGGAQVLLLIVLWIEAALSTTDKAGKGMAFGLLTAFGMILVVCLIPALFLARSERWQPLGLALAAHHAVQTRAAATPDLGFRLPPPLIPHPPPS